ncbi:hypothetical protein NLU13_2341 [Sarocladium strictum]|uniref:SWIM-type domain-containing protein n=1 Tax=Sarocladium strictum TaxID=5046 RepID=A0AA39GVF3_SARSR|nr:hypothetical protein NLU13_5133 [Sarocladium strictum]KAK0392847.1 hypothetical protein NLU13_2341 [Sarocladium strictum]
MSAPASKFSRLSLEAMTPTTRSRALASRASSPSTSSSTSEDPSSDSSGSDSDTESDTIRSPSKLTYQISHLPATSRRLIRDSFSDPPQLALQRCRLVNSTYAFQMTELVTRSVRIRKEAGDGGELLSCSCGGGADGQPCGHLLWLLDRVAEQTLYDRGRRAPLMMTGKGFPEEMGDPFGTIADHTLDVLGPSLHCPVVGGPSPQDGPDVHRVREARELLASVHDEPVDTFRPDIFDAGHFHTGSKILKRGDVDITLLRMLLDNHHFFQYFVSAASRSSTPARDPFRKISQRVDRILLAFDTAHAADKLPVTTPTSPRHAEEQPQRDVPWAAKHILGCTALVRSLIFTRSRPLSPPESLSAARCLTHILTLVTSRNSTLPPTPSSSDSSRTARNLYLYLIGDHDGDFIIGTLGLVPPAAASHFLDTLEGCLDDIGRHGAPGGYVERFRKLLDRLRTSGGGATQGTKRAGTATIQDTGLRESKRMK